MKKQYIKLVFIEKCLLSADQKQRNFDYDIKQELVKSHILQMQAVKLPVEIRDIQLPRQ